MTMNTLLSLYSNMPSSVKPKDPVVRNLLDDFNKCEEEFQKEVTMMITGIGRTYLS